MRSFHRPPLTPQSTRQLQHLLLVATFRISNLLTAVRNSLPLVSLLSHNPALGSSPNCEEVEPRGMWPVLLAPSDFNPPPSSNLVPIPHHCENIDTKAIGLTPKYEAILLRLRRQIVGSCWTRCEVVSRIVWSGGWLRDRDDMKMIRWDVQKRKDS